MIWSSMAPKWPIIVIFCGMDNQKSKFLLIHGIFSVRGCWGQSRLLFWKLDDESQISKTQDHTDTFKHNLTSIFLFVRPKLLLTFQYEIPCIQILRHPIIWAWFAWRWNKIIFLDFRNYLGSNDEFAWIWHNLYDYRGF